MHSAERLDQLWKEVDKLRLQHGADTPRLFRQIKPPQRFQIDEPHIYSRTLLIRKPGDQ